MLWKSRNKLLFSAFMFTHFIVQKGVAGSEELAGLSTLYSRLAIVTETFLATVWLLPAKIGLPVALLALLGMWLLSPTGIIDAIGPLIGLLLGGIALPTPP